MMGNRELELASGRCRGKFNAGKLQYGGAFDHVSQRGSAGESGMYATSMRWLETGAWYAVDYRRGN
jgi:hypothetical protein